jgi:hypothetical protein
METSKLEELPSYGNFQVRETSKLEKLPSYGNFQVMAKWTQCHRSLGNAKLRPVIGVFTWAFFPVIPR